MTSYNGCQAMSQLHYHDWGPFFRSVVAGLVVAVSASIDDLANFVGHLGVYRLMLFGVAGLLAGVMSLAVPILIKKMSESESKILPRLTFC